MCPKEATCPLYHPWDTGWVLSGVWDTSAASDWCGVKVDISLCGITSKSTWFLSLHGWLEHENASWGLRPQTSTDVWRQKGPRWAHLSCSLPQPAAEGGCCCQLSACLTPGIPGTSLFRFASMHSLVIPPARSLFVFTFSFWEAGPTPCSPSSPPETQPEIYPPFQLQTESLAHALGCPGQSLPSQLPAATGKLIKAGATLWLNTKGEKESCWFLQQVIRWLWIML